MRVLHAATGPWVQGCHEEQETIPEEAGGRFIKAAWLPFPGVLFARRIPPATTALHRASLAPQGDGRGDPHGSLISKPASACPFVRSRGRRTDEIPKPKPTWTTWDQSEERDWTTAGSRSSRECQALAQQISPGSGIHRPLRLCGERVNPSSMQAKCPTGEMSEEFTPHFRSRGFPDVQQSVASMDLMGPDYSG
jgi:hypothetical protein